MKQKQLWVLMLSGLCACTTAATRRERRIAQLEAELQGPEGEPSSAAPLSVPASPMIFGHSHNDYAQAHPLRDALALGYRSIEADVWWHCGEVQISHHGFLFDGQLRDLYLAPLQARVEQLGSVYGDGQPFLLWIELKDRDPRLLPALHKLLEAYPMIAAVEAPEAGGRRGPVTIVFTGDAKSKLAYARQPGVHYALVDSDVVRPDPSGAPAQWSTLNWNDWFAWDGQGAMPPAERARLELLVARAHQLGHKLRLYALPESETLWTELLHAGVDLIGTDELPRLQQFLVAHVETRPGAGLLARAAPPIDSKPPAAAEAKTLARAPQPR